MGLLSKIATFFISKILRLPPTISTVGADVLIEEAINRTILGTPRAPIGEILPKGYIRPSILTTVSTEKPITFRKYISMIAYDNPRRQFYALTFEDNDIDREEDLVDELIDFFQSEGFVFASDYGYSQDEASGIPIYPEIEVGYL